MGSLKGLLKRLARWCARMRGRASGDKSVLVASRVAISVAIRRWMLSLVALGIVPVVLLAQATHGPSSVRRDIHHDVSLPLLVLIRHAPPVSREPHEAEPVRPVPLPRGLRPLAEDPVRQWRALGYTPLMSNSFEGLGN